MLRKSRFAKSARGPFAWIPWLAVVVLIVPLAASAVDFSVKLEPGVAIPLTAPQNDAFDLGFGQSVKALIGLTSWLDIGPTVSYLMLSADKKGTEAGVAWGFGGGLRFKRPHDAKGFYGISPWLDADALYIRTDKLNRPGFDAAVGVSIPIGRDRVFWLGPFVRYLQVIQLNRDGYDNRDARVLIAGLSFEVGTGLRREHVEELPPPPPPAQAAAPCPGCPDLCPDRDQDGLPDAVDHCPDVVGPIDNWGCPVYEKVVVKKDKLELKEKIYFAWDEAKIEPVSHPVLDEVAEALKDNKGFRVQVDGHTDSSGAYDYNQGLSEDRANAVIDYLAAKGIARDRLTAKAFSEGTPVQTNETTEGREANRRVEFVVNFILLNDGGSK